MTSIAICPCGCGANVARGARLCLRRRMTQRIETLSRRLDGLRENRGTKGFRTVWLVREALREQLAIMPAANPATTTHHERIETVKRKPNQPQRRRTARVEVASIDMTRAEAYALLAVASEAIASGGVPDDTMVKDFVAAVNKLRTAFGFNIGDKD